MFQVQSRHKECRSIWDETSRRATHSLKQDEIYALEQRLVMSLPHSSL